MTESSSNLDELHSLYVYVRFDGSAVVSILYTKTKCARISRQNRIVNKTIEMKTVNTVRINMPCVWVHSHAHTHAVQFFVNIGNDWADAHATPPSPHSFCESSGNSYFHTRDWALIFYTRPLPVRFESDAYGRRPGTKKTRSKTSFEMTKSMSEICVSRCCCCCCLILKLNRI